MAFVRNGPLENVIPVFLLAENRLLREALIRLLGKKDDIRIVGSEAYSPQAVQQILAAEPAIVVLDSVSKALSQERVIQRLHAERPDIGVVMVGMEADEGVFLRMVREGVLGYVLTDASALEVWRAIRDVAAGEAVCPPSLSVSLFRFVARSQMSLPGERPQRISDFSPRQQQLAGLIREGLSNKEVAARLNLSEQTVKNHVHRMLRKVGAADRLTMAELYRPEAAN
ncbi:MAG: response regulator transcription factor [Candidatus Sulfotelmatobacter sp.]